MSRRFVTAGHRGAMAHRPENSLASFALAEEAGVDQIELDVRMTADGELVVLHDDTLDRVAADERGRGRGPVSELTLAELREIPLASGLPVVTLAEAYEATSVEIQAEIKAPACVEAFAAFLRSHPAYAARTWVTSFHPEPLVALRTLLPDVPRGLIVGSHPDADGQAALAAALAEMAASAFYCHWTGLTPEHVAHWQGLGYQVHAWPLRERADLERALAWGVDGGTADDPLALLAWLREAASA